MPALEYLEPEHSMEVQVVCGLVQEQEVGLHKQGPRERDPHPPTAGQLSCRHGLRPHSAWLPPNIRRCSGCHSLPVRASESRPTCMSGVKERPAKMEAARDSAWSASISCSRW